jgi:hypothetical protein
MNTYISATTAMTLFYILGALVIIAAALVVIATKKN